MANIFLDILKSIGALPSDNANPPQPQQSNPIQDTVKGISDFWNQQGSQRLQQVQDTIAQIPEPKLPDLPGLLGYVPPVAATNFVVNNAIPVLKNIFLLYPNGY